jgi:GNAT superfamily N-acetyltransferase
MNVRKLRNISSEEFSQINILLKKLSPKAPDISQERLDRLIDKESFSLFVTEEEATITGMLTLTRCDTLAKSKYWIEDVVVDPAFRGNGAGRALIQTAISHVKRAEEHCVIYLTSNPSRVEARTLYRSEGFEEYETGVFRIKI